jgi:hypothetical protein
MRRREPVRAGLAARRPMRSGSMAIVFFSLPTMGPKADTPAKPAKKAKVVQARAPVLLDLA